MADAVIHPGRSNAGRSPETSTIVDSMPTSLGPPSRTRSTSEPRSARTWSARVGLTAPKRFADGAAIPPPSETSSAWAIGCAGTRSPTVSCPPVTSSGTPGARRRTNVSGPGQKCRASRCASSDTSRAHRASHEASARWTMSGCDDGRRLTANRRRSAVRFVASAPSPYTVSVGKATSPPARRISAARSISICTHTPELMFPLANRLVNCRSVQVLEILQTGR